MSASLDDDRPSVTRAWIASYGVLYLGVNLAWAAPSQLLIGNQILAWHPENKENLLALIMTVGGLLGLVASPIVGMLSDRTRSRWGRRAPWIVGGAAGAALSLVAMAFAPSFVWLVVLWSVFQVFNASSVTTSQAIPPDRVSRSQYGLVSGVMGISWTLAVVLGTLLAESLPMTAAYAASAALLLALISPFLLHHNDASTLPAPAKGREPRHEDARGDDRRERDERDQRDEADLSGGATDGPPDAAMGKLAGHEAGGLAAYRDFAWVFVSRFTATLGNTVALFYLLYYLRDRVGLDDPDFGVLVLTGIYALAVVASSITAGKLSDLLGVRKPFIAVSLLGVAAACGIMAGARSFPLVIAAATILGVAWGTFTAIDQALINQVLPRAASRGRDVGYMSLSVMTANLLSPALAALALSALGGYPGLYLMSGLLALLGAIAVLNVRSSR